MNAKVRLGAMAAVVIAAVVSAALAGCGSQAQVGAAGHATPACPAGKPVPAGCGG